MLARAPSRAAERRLVGAQADLIDLERRPAGLARLARAHLAMAAALRRVGDDGVSVGLERPFMAEVRRQAEAELWRRRTAGDWREVLEALLAPRVKGRP